MKSGLLTASTLVLWNLFVIAYSGVPYSKNCPKIMPLTELSVDEIVGQYHDAQHTSTTPYIDASYCNYKNGTEGIVTKFYSTIAATNEPYNPEIYWRLGYNKEEPVGYYADVFIGYYEPQQLFFLGRDPDPVDGYYCVFYCKENEDGSFTYIFQYEPRGCKMNEKNKAQLKKILDDNNLSNRKDFIIQDGTTDKCVDDVKCPAEFMKDP